MIKSSRTTYNIACVKVSALTEPEKPVSFRLEPETTEGTEFTPKTTGDKKCI